MKSILLLCLVALVLGNPVFPDQYEVTMTVSLPYVPLVEPIHVWHDGKLQKARRDYYDGMDKYFYYGGKNFSNQIVPMVTEPTCFNNWEEYDLETVLPDLEGYELLPQTKVIRGMKCVAYKFVQEIEKRTNTYVVYVEEGTERPVQMVMMGYDVILMSHYDNYIIDYLEYKPGAPDSTVFDEINNWHCREFPGPGRSMGNADFFQGFKPASAKKNMKYTNEEFEQFMKENGKTYSKNDVNARYYNYMQNKNFVESINRKNLGYKLALNHLADRSESELKRLFGVHLSDDRLRDHSLHQIPHYRYNNTRPSHFDWRARGATGRVKDQSVCGSCWAFGTVGVLEGQYFLKYGEMLDLSEQNLVDCSWYYGNNGCDGGEDFRAYDWMLKNGGIMTAADYGNYLSVDGVCHYEPEKATVKITGYKLVEPYNEDAVMDALLNVGPLSIGINAGVRTFSFYDSGVYNDPDCTSALEDINHAVLLVGYGTEDGQDYWIVKNSWSTYWGEEGYVKIARKNNICGVTSSASYPILA
ncbi:hypothetical protein WA158_002101 [Blastocystis sp. Blastoise]